MECHRCKHRAAIQKQTLRRVPFEKTPCAKCELKEYSEFTLEYDESREVRRQESPSFAKATAGMESRIEDEDERLPISVMREAMVEFLRLPPDIRNVVCWRFAGVSFRDIAALQGITVAGVEVRLWRAMKKWPALTALFGEKAAKQARRKRVSRSQNSESRMFQRECTERRMPCEKTDS